jgi:hypothetical protein
MRRSFVGALVIAGLVMVMTAGRGLSEPAGGYGVNLAPTPQSPELITHVTTADGQPNIITVIDPRQRVMAVYHVDRASGKITPMSVRNFSWDLQMIEFNSGDPLPQDIRSGLQR